MNEVTIVDVKPLTTQVERTDAQIIALWLAKKTSAATRRAYENDVVQFLAAVGKPLSAVTRENVVDYRNALAASGAAASTQSRRLVSVKALYKFAHETCNAIFANPARGVKLPSVPSALAERILSESEVLLLLATRGTGTNPEAVMLDRRNRVMVTLLYVTGLRVSELTGLRWRDLMSIRDEGQVTVVGKGDKQRAVHVYASTWADLVALRGDAAGDAPVFVSRERDADGRARRLDNSQVLRVIRAMAKRAGIKSADRISPHWMRHACASHSLDRDAPISLVQATLGHSSVAVTGRYTHAKPTESAGRYLAIR